MGIFLLARYQHFGLGAEAAGLLLAHLFERYPLRKVYGMAFEQTRPTRGWGRFFREEAHLRQHVWFRGRYWDEYVLAVHRVDWEQLAGRFRRFSGRG
jgi:RimJ/RimL family protein N-acetyltransferase